MVIQPSESSKGKTGTNEEDIDLSKLSQIDLVSLEHALHTPCSNAAAN